MFIIYGMSLPSCLSAEEEKELFPIMKHDPIAKDRVIEGNLRLVAYIAKKFQNTGIETDDLFSVGYVGLVKAVNTYDTSKGIKFATYSSRCISNEILMHLRWNKKKRREIHIDTPVSIDPEGSTLTLGDTICVNNPIEEMHLKLKEEEHARELSLIVRRLSSREREVIELKYGFTGEKPMTQKEIGKVLRLSQSYVSRIEKRALTKIKRALQSRCC